VKSRRVDPEPIVQLRAEVQGLIMAHGFSPSAPDSRWTGKYNIVSWVRRTWKEDEIRLGWRKTPTASYFLDAGWSVARPEGGMLEAAGINPGYMRRGLRFGEFPLRLPVVGAIAERRWRAEIIEDLTFALGWLDACSSVAGAVKEMERPDRNGPRRDSAAYNYIQQFIREHATQ
jgi:hypothetical protein